MSTHELAQLNIGVIKGPMDSPVMADFAASLERINSVAEAAPGFVWRLQTEAGDATAIRPFENENMLVNMSVWKDLDALRKYVYHSAHVEVMRRRREWFEPMSEAFLVLWWVPRGHRPEHHRSDRPAGVVASQGAESRGVHIPPLVSAAGRRTGGIPGRLWRQLPCHVTVPSGARMRATGNGRRSTRGA